LLAQQGIEPREEALGEFRAKIQALRVSAVLKL